jgi:hypothetical protein
VHTNRREAASRTRPCQGSESLQFQGLGTRRYTPMGSRLFANKYIAGMLHMKNIRQIKFTSSFVDTKHWDAIATLESLEELSFNWCTFLQGPADVEPEKRVTVKVSRLRVVGLRQLIAAMDARYLRTLAMDNKSFNQIDWLLPDCSHTAPRLLPVPGSGTGLVRAVPACHPHASTPVS